MKVTDMCCCNVAITRIGLVCYTGLQSGFTALHVAARYGNHRVAAVLIEYGADVNFVAKVCDLFITPVVYLAHYGEHKQCRRIDSILQCEMICNF